MIRHALRDAHALRARTANHGHAVDRYRQHHRFARILELDARVSDGRFGALDRPSMTPRRGGHVRVGRRIRSAWHSRSSMRSTSYVAASTQTRPRDSPGRCRRDALVREDDFRRPRRDAAIVDHHRRPAVDARGSGKRELRFGESRRQQHRQWLRRHRLGIHAARVTVALGGSSVDAQDLSQHGRFREAERPDAAPDPRPRAARTQAGGERHQASCRRAEAESRLFPSIPLFVRARTTAESCGRRPPAFQIKAQATRSPAPWQKRASRWRR